MNPTTCRFLPLLVTCCLVLACDGERKPEATTPADATSKAGESKSVADAKTGAETRAGADTKSPVDAKVVADAKAIADAKVATEAKTAADTKPDTKPTATPPKPVPPRAAVFFREAPKARIALFALPEATAPDPTAVRDLKLTADDEGGSIYHGTSGPVLSADGQWLAYLDEGRLQLARLDGTARHRITKHKGRQVEVLVSGFSPDSSRLMFYQGEVQSEEGTPLPKGIVQGLHELTLADLGIASKTSLEAFRAYTADGRHVVFQRMLPDRSHALVRFDLDTGAEEELQRIDSPFGFSQLVLHDDRIAYTYGPAQGRSRVATDTLRGGARKDVSPEGTFAQYQWPHVSLDGRHVSYTDETTLVAHTLDDDTTRTLFTCAQRHCRHAWDGATTVLVLDGGQLSRVGLDGSATVLATEVKGFVVAGAPG